MLKQGDGVLQGKLFSICDQLDVRNVNLAGKFVGRGLKRTKVGRIHQFVADIEAPSLESANVNLQMRLPGTGLGERQPCSQLEYRGELVHCVYYLDKLTVFPTVGWRP